MVVLVRCLLAGDLSRDGRAFYASRILYFRPEQTFKQLRVAVRKIAFYGDHAIFRDSRHRIEVHFDQASLPLSWDTSWNQWKHLIGAKVGVNAPFIQSGRYGLAVRDSHAVIAWQ